MRPCLHKFPVSGSVALVGVLSTTYALSNNFHINPRMNMPTSPATIAPSGPASTQPTSYFQYGEKAGMMGAHILLMTIAWVFVLPIGVMLSISRSRRSFLIQLVFLVLDGVAIILAIIYNASTPDLYPNNAHHKLGWVLIWVVGLQLLMGVITTHRKRKDGYASIPVSRKAMVEHMRLSGSGTMGSYRLSQDSGHGTQNTESLSSQSSSDEDLPLSPEELNLEDSKPGLVQGSAFYRFVSQTIPSLLPHRLLRVLGFLYAAIDRVILILGFVALTTGMASYGGLFKRDRIFSGLAHWIKGGVFFWYGILTLGRWAGCFADIGWAWNVKPAQDGTGRRPSAEFVESFIIFFYGATNVFLEHLAGWGKAWTSQDLEHVSLTIMFFGGGLCGMLIESSRVRHLLNTTKNLQAHSETGEKVTEPKSYGFSMNPLPALVILLLGKMMSSHHQTSMVSTMIHAQWGTLLMGAAFARVATYVLFYISPPTSILPSRPPTELITAFCLMAGGMIFMSSARDTITAMESNKLDAMFIFVVSMGVVTFLMAWIIVVIAIKGWAVRRENRTLTFGNSV